MQKVDIEINISNEILPREFFKANMSSGIKFIGKW